MLSGISAIFRTRTSSVLYRNERGMGQQLLTVTGKISYLYRDEQFCLLYNTIHRLFFEIYKKSPLMCMECGPLQTC
jgi:hypothetical protein